MFRSSTFFILVSALCLSLLLSTCTKDKGMTTNGYPLEISKILVNKCATAGCHTAASKESAAGLALETWEQLFEGSRNGAVCIPYRHDYSTIFLFSNTDPAKGAVNTPTMPYNKPALSAGEMKTLTDWIDTGAPNSEGKVAFADNPNRKKFYVTNQGCDVVTVFDVVTQLQMRYIDVGASAQIESPHMIKVSPDGKYWYVVFSAASTVMQKYSTADDSVLGAITLGSGSWNTLTISNDGKSAVAVDWAASGKVAYIDLENMNLLGGSPWSGFNDPHGSAFNSNGDTIYVTSTTGNFIYKIPANDPGSFEEISIDPPQLPGPSSQFEPHEIAFAPDSLHYYVTCPKSDEVRVFRSSDDGLETIISTGTNPLEMSFSKTHPYLFVTCEKDLTPPETNRGSVAVIDYTANTIAKNIRTNMSEPHGIAVDDANGRIYVANRNITGGTIPHHTNNCGGTNGFISFISLNTLQVIPDQRIELAADPYSVAVRP